MARRRPFSPEVETALSTASQRHGIPLDTMRAIAQVESRGGAAADRPGSQYRGLFQMGNEAWQRFGGGDRSNPLDNANAAGAMMRSHTASFEKLYGRTPSPAELYTMHNQGFAGARMQWNNPDRPAWQNAAEAGGVSESVGRQRVWQNIPADMRRQYGGDVNNVTGRQFTTEVMPRFITRAGLPADAATAPIVRPDPSERPAAIARPSPQAAAPTEPTGGSDPFEATRQMMRGAPTADAFGSPEAGMDPGTVARTSALADTYRPGQAGEETTSISPDAIGPLGPAPTPSGVPAPTLPTPPEPMVAQPAMPQMPQIAMGSENFGGGGGGGLLGLGGGGGGRGGGNAGASITMPTFPPAPDITAEDANVRSTIPAAPPRTPPGFPVADLLGRQRQRRRA